MATKKSKAPEFVKELEYTSRQTGKNTKFHLMRETVPFIEKVAMTNTVVNFVCPPGRYYPYYEEVVLFQVLAQAYTDVKVEDFFAWLELYENTNIVDVLTDELGYDKVSEIGKWVDEMVLFRRTHNASEEFFRGLSEIFSDDNREKIGKFVSYLADGMEQMLNAAKEEVAQENMNEVEQPDEIEVTNKPALTVVGAEQE